MLQRLGFTYFVLSLLQTLWGQKEIPLTAVSTSVNFNYFSHYTQGEKKIKGVQPETAQEQSLWLHELSANVRVYDGDLC